MTPADVQGRQSRQVWTRPSSDCGSPANTFPLSPVFHPQNVRIPDHIISKFQHSVILNIHKLLICKLQTDSRCLKTYISIF